MLIRPYQRGKAYVDRGRLSVPEWAVERGVMFAVVYTVHEVVHFADCYGHGEHFRAVEKRALGYWGITPEYSSGERYAARLATAFGDVVNYRGLVVSGRPW